MLTSVSKPERFQSGILINHLNVFIHLKIIVDQQMQGILPLLNLDAQKGEKP